MRAATCGHGRAVGQASGEVRAGGRRGFASVVRPSPLPRLADRPFVRPCVRVDIADRVIVRIIWRAAGHGPDLEMRVTHIYTVRNGRLLTMESFWDRDEALKAVGLAE
jgi:ketosteroid isomerase-like protein